MAYDARLVISNAGALPAKGDVIKPNKETVSFTAPAGGKTVVTLGSATPGLEYDVPSPVTFSVKSDYKRTSVAVVVSLQSSLCNDDEYLKVPTSWSPTEPASGSVLHPVTIQMGRAVKHRIGVDYTTGSGTAKSGVDFQKTSGTVFFEPGQSRKTINIPILADALVEGAETFQLFLDAGSTPTTGNQYFVGSSRRNITLTIGDTAPAGGGGGSGGGGTTPPANNTPVAKFSWSRFNGTPGKVSLNASNSYDVDGNTTIKSYEWIVGGKVVTTGKTATAVFTPGSTVSMTLRVTDDKGASNTTTQSIYLVNRAPTFSGMSPENGHVAGSNQPVLGATATDLDGDTLTYSYRITGDRVDVSSDAGVTGTQWTVPPSRLDPGAKYTWSATVSDGTTSVTSTRAISIAMLPVAADVVSTASGQGYWQVASDGGVFTHGDAQFYGSVPGLGLRLTNLMGMARTPSGNGYWVVGSDGGVFSFGDAGFYGSLPGQNIRVNNITGMVPTKSGKGYWLVGTDGGVFSFGDAPFYGSMGGKPLNKPVTAMAATASGGGYWLVARDGGIFSFGDAPFYGSMGGQQLNYPVVDMDVTPDGGGYWLTAEDGGVFSFGNAQFYGSMAGKQLNGHINGMASTPSGKGYWLNGCDGGVFTFGDAPFKGAQSTYQCRGIFYQ